MNHYRSISSWSRKQRRLLSILLALGLSGLSGCVNAAPSEPDNTMDVTGVIERIRQDVGNYELMAAQWRGLIEPRIPDPAMPSPPFTIACPKSVANYDFDITKIEINLQVVSGNTATGDFGLKIPIGKASLGPDLNGSVGQTQTRTIVLDRIPTNDPSELMKFRDGPDYANLTTGHQAFLAALPASSAPKTPTRVFPITDTIIGLRKSLLAASGKLPCFDVVLGEKAGDNIKIDFEIDKVIDPTLGFSFLIVTAKADDKIQSKLDDSITITIAPHSTVGDGSKPVK